MWSPFCTLIVTSWPPTSGATRISVVRTTPTRVAVSLLCHSAYPPALSAMRTRPSTACVRLSMQPPPHDDIGGHYREQEIENGQQPEPAPVVHNLREACSKLVDAHEAVDREIGREHVAGGENRPRDRFAWPGETGQEELRQAGGEKDKRRRLGAREPGA